MDGLREFTRSVKNEVKGAVKESKTWVKTNVVAPVQEMLGLREGARRRKGQVEEFFNDIGGDGDLHSLSQLLADNLAQRSSVEIVDINSDRKNTRRRHTAHAGPRSSLTPDKQHGSWFKRMAQKTTPIFARCTNKDAVEDDDTYGDSGALPAADMRYLLSLVLYLLLTCCTCFSLETSSSGSIDYDPEHKLRPQTGVSCNGYT